MNYDDELERARAKRSRKRASGADTSRGTRISHSSENSRTSFSSGTEHTSSATRTSTTARATQTVQSANGTRAAYRRKKKKNKTKKIVLGAVLGFFVLIAAAVFGVYSHFANKIKLMDDLDFKVPEVENINLSEEKREQMQKGFMTVAVFGVDSRDNSLGKGNQSDVIMIANLNRETGEIKLVSVYRDTYLNISDKNTYNKINAAYASGGPEAAVKAINKNMDLNITHYATFNWKAVATVINILGGVEIDISPSEFYYINAFITETVKGTGIGSVQLKAPGVHKLDGVQAVAYGRLRLMDSDFARTERQRIVLAKAFEKLKSADLATLNSVVGHVMEMSSTNIKWEELLSLAGGIKKYHLGETTGFPAARGDAKIKIGSNRLSCVIPQTLESNVISLHKFLYGEENYVPSATVKEISAKIAEISGLATEAEEIGSVAVDQGYIPKKTTQAATEPKTEAESESSTVESAEASSEGESESTGEGESESTGEGESESGTATESGSAAESEPGTSIPARPGTIGGPGSNTSASTEGYGPAGPSSTTPSTEGYGPGSATDVTEATTSSGPGSMTSPGGQTSVTISPSAPGSTTTNPSSGAPGSTTTNPSSGAPGSAATSPSVSAPGSAAANSSTGTTSGPSGIASAITNSPGGTSTGTASTTAPSSPSDITISAGGGSGNGPASQATSAAAPGA